MPPAGGLGGVVTRRGITAPPRPTGQDHRGSAPPNPLASQLGSPSSAMLGTSTMLTDGPTGSGANRNDVHVHCPHEPPSNSSFGRLPQP